MNEIHKSSSIFSCCQYVYRAMGSHHCPHPWHGVLLQLSVPLHIVHAAAMCRGLACDPALTAIIYPGPQQVNPSTDQCCNPATEVSMPYSTPCPCLATDGTCPSGEACCLPSSPAPGDTGDCYSTLNTSQYRCCYTGAQYQVGVDQCCPVDGLVPGSQVCAAQLHAPRQRPC